MEKTSSTLEVFMVKDIVLLTGGGCSVKKSSQKRFLRVSPTQGYVQGKVFAYDLVTFEQHQLTCNVCSKSYI